MQAILAMRTSRVTKFLKISLTHYPTFFRLSGFIIVKIHHIDIEICKIVDIHIIDSIQVIHVVYFSSLSPPRTMEQMVA